MARGGKLGRGWAPIKKEKGMFGEFWGMIPGGFKVIWFAAAAIGLGFTGFVVWAIYKVVMHVTGS